MRKVCVAGINPNGVCGAAAFCPESYPCCAACKKDCNIRCGYCVDPREDAENNG